MYRVSDAGGAVIYIGKAKNLRRRLSQYRNHRRCRKHARMRGILKDGVSITWDLFPTELDAALEEIRLIQSFRPKWNIVSAHSHRYPYLALSAGNKSVIFGFSSKPESLEGLTLFGAYRSPFIVAEAFFALMRLIAFVGHREKNQKEKRRGVYLFGFRQLPPGWDEQWKAFFAGRSVEALESLSLRLLENAGARAKAADVQEDIDSLKRFWKHEALRLAEVIEELGIDAYPVAQADRDLIFLRYRLRQKEA